ncbi:zinc ribbon domain-containing protein [Candidatus Frankia alpina]|uniref:zinc ribbon domain-containing protein n=1 Tax=Candidatus Frankia alpina TaxID=2699483 RepID=UPI0022A766DD|nr:zinc ribbon domain-containing protein [Candidatus Frankia alpina]
MDRFYPSSKTCSSCGVVVAELPLHIWEWEWECVCGAVHDRDVNAAKNVLAAGSSAVCPPPTVGHTGILVPPLRCR